MDQNRLSRNSSDIPGLRCYLLGAPRVEINGQTVTISRRQTRALLFYLASHPQPISREILSFIFWADSSETIARNNLSRLLNQLKTALGIDNVLIQSRDVVGLERDRMWTDVIEFSSAVGDQNCSRAIALYTGPFMEGFSLPNCPEYERWLVNENYHLEQSFLACLEAELQTHSSQERYREAIELAHRYLQTDELAEPIHRKLIELHALNGDRAAAMAQYEQCLLILERELGVDALPETQAVAQAILHRNPINEAAHPDVIGQAIHQSLEIPFVGREHIIENINQTLDQAVSQQGSAILLIGESGIGKTRILQHFLNQVRIPSIILEAQAELSTQTLPYQLITQALRSGFESGWLPEVTQPSRVSEAARLLPELTDLLPDLPPLLPLDSESAQLRLFDALSQLIVGWTSKNTPIILCLDDLHWADAHSLQWLAYFGGQISSKPILILATCRHEERSILHELVLGSSHQNPFRKILIEGLTLNETEQAFEATTQPRVVDEQLLHRVWKLSAGNPFFIKETIQSLLESPDKFGLLEDDAQLYLPTSLVQAANVRVGLLSDIAKQVLDSASVIGKKWRFDLIRQVSGRGEEEVGAALDQLVDRSLLIDEGGQYRFQHEIIQLTVYDSLSHWRRRLLHRRAAEATAKEDPSNHTQLCKHYEMGEQFQLAAAEIIQTGRAIKHIFAYQEALKHFNHALNLLDKDDSFSHDPKTEDHSLRLRIQALTERGWVYRLLGEMDAYEQDLAEEARIVEKLGDQQARIHLYLRQAALQRWWCRYNQAFEAAKNGLRLNQAVGDQSMEGRAWREIGLAYREQGDFPQAQPPLEKALQFFERVDDHIMQIHTLSNLSTLYGHQGDFGSAEKCANQAMNICDQREMIFERRLPLGDLGAVAAGMRQWNLAQRLLTESLEISKQIDDRTQEIFCLAHLGYVALGQRRTVRAQQCLTEALDLAKKINSCGEQSRLHLSLAQVYLIKGEKQQALIYAETALQLASHQGRGIEIEIANNLLQKI